MRTVDAFRAGLLPVLWRRGTESGPMVDGIVSSTIGSLLVIPAR